MLISAGVPNKNTFVSTQILRDNRSINIGRIMKLNKELIINKEILDKYSYKS